MIRQQALNDAVAGLLTQRDWSANPVGQCFYRHPNGNRCAVGFLISDEEYNPEIELTDLEGIIGFHLKGYEGIDKYFLKQMQKQIHDQLVNLPFNFETFKDAVLKFAAEFDLNSPPALEYNGEK